MVNLDKQIDEVMDYFNFTKVEKAMKALDWVWPITHGLTPPDEPDIRAFARELMKRTVSASQHANSVAEASTGGFRVRVDPHDGVVSLLFQVDAWDAFNVEERVEQTEDDGQKVLDFRSLKDITEEPIQ